MDAKPKEVMILDETFNLISIEPPFRTITIKNLLRLAYSLLKRGKEGSKIRLKEVTNFNETYVHCIYKMIEYLKNEVFANFMLEIFEDEIKAFE